jgi:hypothetical protein
MKEKNNLPTRSDPIYGEIERFEDYEYTNCIAYEMAIRNDEAKKIYEGLYHVSNLNEYKKRVEKLNFYGLRSVDEDIKESQININSRYTIDDIQDGFRKLVYFYMKKNEIYTLSETNDSIGLLDITGEYPDKFTYSEFEYFFEMVLKSSFEYYVRANDDESFIPLSTGYKNLISLDYLEKDFIDTLKETDFIANPRIISSDILSRTLLILDNSKTGNFDINLALPKDELMAYISKIKDEYDKDNSIIKRPLELIGEDLSVADENLLIHKGTGKYNKYRVADMFFIYDGIKKGMRKAKIINELNYYYYDKDNKNTNYDYKTLDKYYEIATELIDNLKYKELITGVKN